MLDNLLSSLSVVLPLLLLVCIGAFTRRIGIVTEDLATRMNNVVFKVFLPCKLFASFFSSNKGGQRGGFYLFCIVGILIYFVVVNLFVKLLTDKKPSRASIAQASLRGNTIIYGLPLAAGILTEAEIAEVLGLLGLLIFVTNLLGVLCIELQLSHKLGLKTVVGILKNPVVAATLLGLAFQTLELSLPSVILSPINTLADCTTGVAFLVLGATFTVKASMKNIKYILWAALLKLVIMPLAFLSVGIGVFGFTSGVEVVSMLCFAATPTAVSAVPISKAMGADGELTGEIVVVATALSIATLFVIIFILKSLLIL